MENVPIRQRAQYFSHFTNTYRNLLLYSLANTLIVPAYLTCIYQITWLVTDQTPLIGPEQVLSCRIAIGLVSLLPLFLILFTPSYWHMGFRDREPLIVTCAFVILALCVHSMQPFELNQTTVELAMGLSAIWVFICVIYVTLRWRWKYVVLSTVGILFTLLISLLVPHLDLIFPAESMVKNLGLVIWGLVAICNVGYALYRIISWVLKHLHNISTKKRFWLLRIY